MIVFRHTDPRFPFLWEDSAQPAARWHDEGEGPVHYLADTPHGAWAELVRHEEIVDAEDLAGVRRSLWAVELSETPDARPDLEESQLLGGPETYAACRREAARKRDCGEIGLLAPSAALMPGQASGWRVNFGLESGPERDGQNYVLFGPRPDLVGWPVTDGGAPPEEVLRRVRHLVMTRHESVHG